MDERKRDAERKREQRKAGKLVHVPPCADRERRESLEADDEEWLLYYFSERSGIEDPFTYRFVSPQREMIAAIRNAIKFGGDQAIAASRGEGKTIICERLLLKYVLQGVVPFAVLFAATGELAANSLASIKMAIEENVLLLEDYPEVCVPVRSLEYAAQRAGKQIVSGHRHDNGEAYVEASSRFTWCGSEVFFPRVPGSPSARAIIATRGLDSAVRGIRKLGRRPTVAVIDDPDTEDTVRSEDQAKKLEDRIDKGIAGLGTQQKPISRVFLSTLQNRTCVSYTYTDRTKKPSFKGRRFRFLVKPPNRVDLWDEYIQLCHSDFANSDQFCRTAHAFFAERQEGMTAGAEIANPHRYDSSTLEDGTQRELSALQRYYNLVAQIGQEAVDAEYNNDPAEESGPIESGITAHRVQCQVSGYDRKVIPPGCVAITQGIDVRKIALHWVVRAWQADGSGFTIDYGVTEVHGTTVGTDDGVDVAIRRAIHGRMEQTHSDQYATIEGDVMPVSLTLVDAGWRTQAIYQACRELGLGIMPAMGFGKSAGCAKANFSPVSKQTESRIPGDGWFFSRVDDSFWFCAMDADRWKAWEHDRWMTAPDRPGAMRLYGEPSQVPGRLSFDQKGHFSYSKHITAEIEVEEPVKNGLVRKWKSKSDNNHWLDASYMANVAGHIKGIRLLQPKREPKPQQSNKQITEPNEQPFLASARD